MWFEWPVCVPAFTKWAWGCPWFTRSRFLRAESQPGAWFPKQISQSPVWSAALLILHSFSCHIHSAATQIFPFSPRSEGLWEPHLPTPSLGRLSPSFLSLSLSLPLSLSLSLFHLSWEQHAFRVYSLSVSAVLHGLLLHECFITELDRHRNPHQLRLNATMLLGEYGLCYRFVCMLLFLCITVVNIWKNVSEWTCLQSRYVVESGLWFISLCCLERSFEMQLCSGFM